jgi:ketosteroid isomerase-like protein
MRTFLIAAAVSLLLVPTAAECQDRSADEAAIRKLVEQVNAIHNRHEIEPLVALFDETVEDWTGQTKGREAYKKNLTDLFAREKNRIQEEIEEIGIVFVTDGVAIYKSTRVTKGTVDADGKPLPPEKVIFARVVVKREGRWYLAAWFGAPLNEQ